MIFLSKIFLRPYTLGVPSIGVGNRWRTAFKNYSLQCFAEHAGDAEIENASCVPYLVRHNLGTISYQPMKLKAGLWDVWRGDPEGGELYTFTIITTNANALLRPIHQRMPVIIDSLRGDMARSGGFTSRNTFNPFAAASVRVDGRLRSFKTGQ